MVLNVYLVRLVTSFISLIRRRVCKEHIPVIPAHEDIHNLLTFNQKMRNMKWNGSTRRFGKNTLLHDQPSKFSRDHFEKLVWAVFPFHRSQFWPFHMKWARSKIISALSLQSLHQQIQQSKNSLLLFHLL